MTIQKYLTPIAPRNLIRAEMKMLQHAQPIMVLGTFGLQKSQPLNSTDTIVFRRLRPFNSTTQSNPADGYSETPVIAPANFVVAEGVTPNANTISYTDVSVTLNNYALLYKFSSKAALMYEDDIPADQSEQAGEAAGEIAELVALWRS